jgi:hypothetical protein
MFFEIWKRQNKKKLDKLNKIAPYIEPTEQSKIITQEIAKKIIYSDDLEKYRQVNGSLNDEGRKIFSERVKNYLGSKGE